MAVMRVVKNKDYSIVHNGFINNKNLSFKAKGILLYFLSKPDNWDFYLKEMALNSKDGVESIKAGISELENLGYIHKSLKRSDNGKLSGGYDYTVYEIPQPKQENTDSVKNLSDNLPIKENHSLINTELSNNTNNKYAESDAEDIWSIYPNKKGKSKSIYYILKILKKLSKEELTRAVERYSLEVENVDKKFILYGSSFFSGRYEDYLDDNYSQIKSSSKSISDDGIREF